MRGTPRAMRNRNERGAALIIVIAVSMLLTSAAGAFYMLTRSNATRFDHAEADVFLREGCHNGMIAAEARLLSEKAADDPDAFDLSLSMNDTDTTIHATRLDHIAHETERDGERVSVACWKLSAVARRASTEGGHVFSMERSRVLFVETSDSGRRIGKRITWSRP